MTWAALNTMLARLEQAFAEQQASEERLRRFVADASHELRTPVATIRGYAELYRRGGLDDPAQLDQAMRRTEAEVRAMGDLVDDLLLLARLDQGRPLERSPVDLGVLAVGAAADARAMAPGGPCGPPSRRAWWSRRRAPAPPGRRQPGAQRHRPHAGRRRHHHARPPDGGRGVVEVCDEGPGMPPDQAAAAFERFYRATRGEPATGAARASGSPSCGPSPRPTAARPRRSSPGVGGPR